MAGEEKKHELLEFWIDGCSLYCRCGDNADRGQGVCYRTLQLMRSCQLQLSGSLLFFPATIDKVEYETLITGLSHILLPEWGLREINVNCDLQLVVEQVLGKI